MGRTTLEEVPEPYRTEIKSVALGSLSEHEGSGDGSFLVQKYNRKEGNRMNKTGILAILGMTGAFISTLFGGWDAALTTLVIFMATDYIAGLVVAGIFHKSGKSENGTLKQ